MFVLQTERTSSMLCITLAHHHILVQNWNPSLATVPTPMWLVGSVLCAIDASQHRETQPACAYLFYTGIFHCTTANKNSKSQAMTIFINLSLLCTCGNERKLKITHSFYKTSAIKTHYKSTLHAMTMYYEGCCHNHRNTTRFGIKCRIGIRRKEERQKKRERKQKKTNNLMILRILTASKATASGARPLNSLRKFCRKQRKEKREQKKEKKWGRKEKKTNSLKMLGILKASKCDSFRGKAP